MSRKRCIRRHWTPVNPIAHVIEGLAVTPTAKLDKLRMLELSALESFRTGKATPDDWRAIADVCNLAETLALDGVGVEVLDASRTAQEALGQAHERYKAQGKLGITGLELQALRDVVEFHDIQRTSIGLAVYEAAIRKTRDRIRSAHPSVKTCIT
jgi:hypothetical protein